MVDLSEFTAEQLRDEIRARSRMLGQPFELDAPAQRDALAGIPDDQLLRALLRLQKHSYGVNARVEAWQSSPEEQADAKVVAGLLPARCLVPAGADFELLLPTYAERIRAVFGQPLADSEAYREQPAGVMCSGCLVEPDLVLTVGRFVAESSLKSHRFVFDFAMDSSNDCRRIRRADVYVGTHIVDSEIDPNGEDWALVRLDRPVVDRQPARLRRTGTVSAWCQLHVAGHPLGLPLKVAGSATVRGSASLGVFVANLDAFGGGPGAPVFNSETHEVEGMLARGGAELVALGGSVFSLICPASGCLGAVCVDAASVPLPSDPFASLRLRRPHQRGERVRQCQELVRRHGFEVPTDGVFGPKTRAAVRAFQRREGLEATGVVDSDTHSRLQS
jgi:hypothetical protein